jgi:8-oxo-dGTP diphosphatase
MSYDPQVHVGVAAWIVNPMSGKLLMLQRSPHAVHGGGKWSVPGGWVDYGELPHEAVIREVKEETGLDTHSPELIGVVANTWQTVGHVVCVFYTLKIEGTLVFENMEPEKHIKMVWANLENFDHQELFAPLVSFIRGE